MVLLVFQVRPEADTFILRLGRAMERFLTGEQGKSRNQVIRASMHMIEECHRCYGDYEFAWILILIG